MAEQLHATDRHGAYLKTGLRPDLFREIRDQARQHGEAPFAVPVIHVILLTSGGLIRLVQRGDKLENPFLWDKAVGGHVVTSDRSLPRKAFDNNVRKEMGEEIGVENVRIAQDALDYHHLLRSGDCDLHQQAVIRMIDYDPWQGALARVRDGESWLKRSNVVVYAGVFDGPFRFVDGEAIDHRAVARAVLMHDLWENPWPYADGTRVFMERYYHLLV